LSFDCDQRNPDSLHLNDLAIDRPILPVQLTRRPTRIAEYMSFDMARPRDGASMSDPSFVATKGRALEIFLREVRA